MDDYYIDENETVIKADRKSWEAFGRLMRGARVPWVILGIACALSIASAKLSVLFPDYSVKFFEAGEITRRTIMTGIGLLLASALVSIVNSYIEARLRTGLAMRLRDRVLEKIMSLSVPSLNKLNPRELISRTANDTGALSDFIVTTFMVLTGEAFQFIFAMQKIYGYSRGLFIFQLAFIPISFLVHFVQGSISYRYQYRVQLRLSRLTEYLSEFLINIPLIKIFAKEDAEIERGSNYIDSYAKIRARSTLLESVFGVIDEAVRLGGRVFAILYGGHLVHQGAIGIGTWIAYFILAEQVIMNINMITMQWTLLKDAQGAVARTAEIMEMDEEERDGKPPKRGSEAIIFEDADINIGDKNILSKINAEIKAGESIAIVGRSGSGKSTLLKSIIRFYEADSGSIKLGEKDVRSLDLDAYRRLFSYVFQDVKLFNGSLRDNFTYGVQRDVADEEILERCRQVGLEGFIDSQSEGLDSVVSEGATNVSGGERQRIGIVRALLREPVILLMDEATSNLDASTESQIMDEIEKEYEDKTLIMVSHRMAPVKRAKRIIYMEDGNIKAIGTHDELMADCEGYRKLAKEDGNI